MKVGKLILALSLLSAGSALMAQEPMTVKAETIAAVTSAPTVEAIQKNDTTVLISPRTGMRYTVNNPNNIPIVFKTELLAPATPSNVNRIVATNPALSATSQEKAQAALVALISPQADTAPVAAVTESAAVASAETNTEN